MSDIFLGVGDRSVNASVNKTDRFLLSVSRGKISNKYIIKQITR